MANSEQIRAAAAPLLASAGLELWDVEVGRDVVRILVDRSGGVDLDALSAASHALSPLFDEREDLVPAGHYQLEVSSPGIERTLRDAGQYRRSVGSLVSVKTRTAVDGARRFRGTLVSASDDAFVLAPEDGPVEMTQTFRYEQVDRTRTVAVWGDPAGRRPRSARPRGGTAGPAVADQKDAAS